MTTIILAAGLSQRMGKNKLLLEYKGKQIIKYVVEGAVSTSNKVVVVTGFERKKIEKVLSNYDITLVHNPRYEEGQMTSIKCGLDAVIDDDFAFVTGDLPLIKNSDFEIVFKAIKHATIARTIYEGEPGHPIAYKKTCQEKLLAFPGTTKEFNRLYEVTYVNGSFGTIFDIDTPEKYEKLLTLY